jgi:hypothetical protein
MLTKILAKVYHRIEKVQTWLIQKDIEEPKPRLGSYPYLSGDSFLQISDCAILRGHNSPLVLKDKSKPKILFVEGELLEQDWVINYCRNFKAVICHNADKPVSESTMEILRSQNCYIFATNIQWVDQFSEPIPIGIENAHLRRNGSLHHYNLLSMARLNLAKKQEILVSFSVETNPSIRKDVEQCCREYGLKNETKLDLRTFRKRLGESYFIVSPPGNGIDCHRTWEAIYHGCIPIIEGKYNLFKHLKLPIATFDSLREFLELNTGEKLRLYSQIMRMYTPEIYMDWWINHINTTITRREK